MPSAAVRNANSASFGDGVADFMIRVDGLHTLAGRDFTL